MTIAVVMFFVGVGFLGLSSIIFILRALSNKPAWEGLTVPLLLVGLLIFIASLVLLFFAYDK
jgi:hypothetical protein